MQTAPLARHTPFGRSASQMYGLNMPLLHLECCTSCCAAMACTALAGPNINLQDCGSFGSLQNPWCPTAQGVLDMLDQMHDDRQCSAATQRMRPRDAMWVCLQVGSTLFSVVIITVHLQLASMLTYWTWVHHLCIWGGIGKLPC